MKDQEVGDLNESGIKVKIEMDVQQALDEQSNTFKTQPDLVSNIGLSSSLIILEKHDHQHSSNKLISSNEMMKGTSAQANAESDSESDTFLNNFNIKRFTKNNKNNNNNKN
jgi:hypothetical protein